MGENAKTRRHWIYLSILAAWLVWISGVFGNSGVWQAYQLAQVRRDMALKIRALENEKIRLQSVAHDLEKNPYTQEVAIRETLGFVRPNELVFEFR
jgi:cell division protein FtsB